MVVNKWHENIRRHNCRWKGTCSISLKVKVWEPYLQVFDSPYNFFISEVQILWKDAFIPLRDHWNHPRNFISNLDSSEFVLLLHGYCCISKSFYSTIRFTLNFVNLLDHKYGLLKKFITYATSKVISPQAHLDSRNLSICLISFLPDSSICWKWVY